MAILVHHLLALGDVQIRVQIFRRVYSQHEVRFSTPVADKTGRNSEPPLSRDDK
jgi:hypothetical protein